MYPAAAVGLPRDLADRLDALTRINTDEFVDSLGLGWVSWGRPLLQQLCRPAARRISRDMARFDGIIARRALRQGARDVLDELIGTFEVHGAERLPRVGPLLILANHPGVCDVLTICATIEREDLLVVAADYPLLRALNGINRYFLFVGRGAGRRRAALGKIMAHLQSGGAMLILPAGQIEPDPALSCADSLLALDGWSRSIGVIAPRVDGLVVVPAIVSGVLIPRFQQHPLTWIRRRAADRQRLGTALQVLAGASATTSARLTYGRPIPRSDLVALGGGSRAITRVVVDQARILMQGVARGDTAPAGVHTALITTPAPARRP
jgi:1-acyl-sn-glycerol-3-phosphate acyltransferase